MSVCMIYSSLFGFLSFVLFIFSLYSMVKDVSLFFEYSFILINSSSFSMTILLDWMSLLFMSFVLFISGMVIYYSDEYMGGDLNLGRFITLVVMFVFSMILLIISPNLVSILLGWDGLGLVSYCLVIYYQNFKSFNAGMLTALSNRLGDVALLMSIAWMLNYGGWNYIFYLEEMNGTSYMMIITWLVVLAGMTKSAQIPFSSWLPAAMAAPTPVSSLVHSSTLVTAGVYLLIRFNLAINDTLFYVLLFASMMTMFMSGLGANFEFDLKKIIALSTLSQLGLMMSILCLGGYKLAFFHLLAHALFKALLFMCAGNVIHNLGNCQDIRYMGGLVNQMPLTCMYFNICNLSLCGLPFLSGFYSKDLILESLSMGYLNIYVYMVFYLSVGLTACYSFRLCYYTCLGHSYLLSLNSGSENSYIMLSGMTGLIFLVVFMGSLLSWVMFSFPYLVVLPFSMKMMALFMVLIGIWFGLEAFKFSLGDSNLCLEFYSISWFLSNMWYMPLLSTHGMSFGISSVGSWLFKNMDQGWSEYYGAQRIYSGLVSESKYIQLYLNNSIKIYFVMLFMWLLIIFLI